MRGAERGYLLLCSQLGDPNRRILTVAQFRTLARRVRQSQPADTNRQLELSDLRALGYGDDFARQILHLLSEESLLDWYLARARREACTVVTKASSGFPQILDQKLGLDCPGCLWLKGDPQLLNNPMISLVGSREIRDENREFAQAVGIHAAEQGYTLVSGNARGADRIAQESCLRAGGKVISVVADSLRDKKVDENILYISEDSFNLPFSPQRAISRNRIIHCLGSLIFVAQSDLHSGGTWDGTVKNLRGQWSSVFCFRDGSPASVELHMLGASFVGIRDLSNIHNLHSKYDNFFDQ